MCGRRAPSRGSSDRSGSFSASAELATSANAGPFPFLGDRLAVLGPFDAGVQDSLRVQPVQDPLREVVLLVLEDDAPVAELDELEGRRRSRARAGEVERPLARPVDAEELPGGESPAPDVAVETEEGPSAGSGPVLLHRDAVLLASPTPLEPGQPLDLVARRRRSQTSERQHGEYGCRHCSAHVSSEPVATPLMRRLRQRRPARLGKIRRSGGRTRHWTCEQRAEREPNSLRRARGGFRGARRSAPLLKRKKQVP